VTSPRSEVLDKDCLSRSFGVPIVGSELDGVGHGGKAEEGNSSRDLHVLCYIFCDDLFVNLPVVLDRLPTRIRATGGR